MKIANLSIADYTQKIPSPAPYKVTKKNNLGGCYILWADSALKKELSPLTIEMHCSISVFEQNTFNQPRPDYANSKIRIPLQSVIEDAATESIEGHNLFCLYVGKTANLTKRAPHSFKSFFSNLKSADGKSLSLKFNRENCYLSFIEIPDWKDRFYTENLLIAALKPVINLQPER